ncbi:unnamed protein product [Rotaria sp. Silwood2]|nr:unnamed protein product [Rotaria sp. Silwood2]
MYLASFFILVVVSLTVDNTKSVYSRAEYTDCGSQDVNIHSIDIHPMPIRYPGSINLTLAHTIKRPIKAFQLSVRIIRTIGGISLPFSCYIVKGFHVGSCDYTSDQICHLINNWWPKTFGLYLTSLVSTILGNNCNGSVDEVPMNQIIVYNEMLELSAFPEYMSWLTVGDFKLKIMAMEQDRTVFCGTFKYTTLPRRIK